MNLFRWVLSLFRAVPSSPPPTETSAPAKKKRKKRPRRRLIPFRHTQKWFALSDKRRVPAKGAKQKPYEYAYPGLTGGFIDLTQDGDDSRLAKFDLPRFRTPQELADWLQIPIGRLAWLAHRFELHRRPKTERAAHYHYAWIDKRSRGRRLIESPKPRLKAAQNRILREILDRVPAHASAHGFVIGRSPLTNAEPHIGQRVIVKLDLENFYPGISFNRVVAIFRGLGYCREAAIWLALLTTSRLPDDLLDELTKPGAPRFGDWIDSVVYGPRHLPQGAPTSPTIANLSAFSLDLRLSGLARSFGIEYTRYADDLTFSGDEKFLRSLAVFLPLVEQIIKSCRFRVNKKKRRVIRNSQRQQVTGVVVNEKPNVSRADYDRLKATLTNCIRRGPSTQNHDRLPDFAAHLRGRIAHVSFLNPKRGARLLALYRKIDWRT